MKRTSTDVPKIRNEVLADVSVSEKAWSRALLGCKRPEEYRDGGERNEQRAAHRSRRRSAIACTRGGMFRHKSDLPGFRETGIMGGSGSRE